MDNDNNYQDIIFRMNHKTKLINFICKIIIVMNIVIQILLSLSKNKMNKPFLTTISIFSTTTIFLNIGIIYTLLEMNAISINALTIKALSIKPLSNQHCVYNELHNNDNTNSTTMNI